MPQLSDLALLGGPEGGVVEELAVVAVGAVLVVLVAIPLMGASGMGSGRFVSMAGSWWLKVMVSLLGAIAAPARWPRIASSGWIEMASEGY